LITAESDDRPGGASAIEQLEPLSPAEWAQATLDTVEEC
jgi:hypothetical protein